MRTISYTFAAGETKAINVYGKYLRVIVGLALDISYYKNNAYNGEKAQAIDAGYYAEPLEAFDRIDITSPTAQTVKIAVSMGLGGYDLSPTGNVSLTSPINATGSNAQATVTTTAAQLVAANTARKYLLIQNKDVTGNIWINFGGTATQANGIKIAPGGSYELNSAILTGAISAISDIASNANIVVVTG